MSIRGRIAAAVMAWPGVEQAPHRFGGIEFRLGKRELGHLRGVALADLPFPRKVREELRQEYDPFERMSSGQRGLPRREET